FAGVEKSASTYLPSNWKYQDLDDNIQLFLKPESAAEQSSLAINIDSELQISAIYHGWTSVTSEVLNNINVKETTLSNILHIVHTSIICEGITGSTNSSSATCQHFEVSFSRSSSKKIEQGPPQLRLLASRSLNCEVFISSGKRCKQCFEEEKRIVKSSESQKKYFDVKGCLPLKRLQQNSLESRKIATVKAKDDELNKLEDRIKQLLAKQKCHVLVDTDIAEDMNSLIKKGIREENVSPFYRLFWSEQAKLNATRKHGERYHPDLIRFCLNLALKSSSTYDELRNSSLLVLPSRRTLIDYRNVYSTNPGFSESVRKELKQKASELPDHERLIVLSMDEMKGMWRTKIDITTQVLSASFLDVVIAIDVDHKVIFLRFQIQQSN
ncbi:uncharacterized protein LOC120329287, partial [Styela clava]